MIRQLIIFSVLFMLTCHVYGQVHHRDIIHIPDHPTTFTKDSSNIDFWKERPNRIMLAVNELLGGSLGITYERYLHRRHTVGVVSSTYFAGWGSLVLFSYGTAKFTGIKLSPFYRFYYFNNPKSGGYLEAKVTYGYLHFRQIYYYRDYSASYRGFYATENSSSFGFGVTAGFNFRPREGIFNYGFSIGLQAFPPNLPKTLYYDDYGGLICEPDDAFWFVMGPGAVLEIKLLIGFGF